MPGLEGANSRLVVPVMSLGELVGVIVADSARPAAFGAEEEHVLGVVATMLGTAIEQVRTLERQPDEQVVTACPAAASGPGGRGDGRPLLRRRRQHVHRRRVPHQGRRRSHPVVAVAASTWDRPCRLQATAYCASTPAFSCLASKDNLESRLILLKRRSTSAVAPIRLERTGRGRSASTSPDQCI